MFPNLFDLGEQLAHLHARFAVVLLHIPDVAIACVRSRRGHRALIEHIYGVGWSTICPFAWAFGATKMRAVGRDTECIRHGCADVLLGLPLVMLGKPGTYANTEVL